jgi:uncharacterized membrane protein
MRYILCVSSKKKAWKLWALNKLKKNANCFTTKAESLSFAVSSLWINMKSSLSHFSIYKVFIFRQKTNNSPLFKRAFKTSNTVKIEGGRNAKNYAIVSTKFIVMGRWKAKREKTMKQTAFQFFFRFSKK